jgi:hypothetical protein
MHHKFNLPKKEAQLIYLKDENLSLSDVDLFGSLP